MLPEIANLLETYKSIESSLNFYKEENNKILLPVNINLLHSQDQWYSTYSRNYNYKYRDEYLFDDKLLIYDLKTGFNVSKKNLLENLRRTNNIKYYKKNKSVYETPDKSEYKKKGHARKSYEHVNWIDNGRGIKLKDILQLKPSHSKAFSAADKHIHLNYNYLHQRRIPLYSLYLIPGGKIENLHSKITFGKMKENTQHFRKIFKENPNNWSVWCRVKSRSLSEEQIAKLQNITEGYEGVCDSILLSNEDLNNSTPSKWSTPYVAYDYRSLGGGKREYYQYVLGDYSESERISENLLGNLNKRIWAVDYDNVFRMENKNGHLLINVNRSAVSAENTRDFLKISDFFNFVFTFGDREETKTLTFDLREILSGNAKIPFNENGSMFSNFSLSIKLKEDRGRENIELLDGLESKKYTVNIDELKKANMILDHIEVSEKGINKLMPSQFGDDGEMVKYFHFSSAAGERKVNFTETLLKKMNVERKYDDVEGILKIKFRDLINNTDREITWSGMKKIPTQRLVAVAQDVNEAKSKLREKKEFNDLPQYFWDSLEFTPIQINDFWKTHLEHKVSYSGPNKNVKEDWDRLIKSKIEIFNELNFHTDSLVISEEKANGPAENLFKSKDINGNYKSLSKDLLFTKVSRNGDFLKVSVSANNTNIKADKEFDFQVTKPQEMVVKVVEEEKIEEKKMEEVEEIVEEVKKEVKPERVVVEVEREEEAEVRKIEETKVEVVKEKLEPEKVVQSSSKQEKKENSLFNLFSNNIHTIATGTGFAIMGGGAVHFYRKAADFFSGEI